MGYDKKYTYKGTPFHITDVFYEGIAFDQEGMTHSDEELLEVLKFYRDNRKQIHQALLFENYPEGSLSILGNRDQQNEFLASIMSNPFANESTKNLAEEFLDTEYALFHPKRVYTQEYLIRKELAKNYKSYFCKLSERDGTKCKMCGSLDFLQIDHIRPVTRGGTNDLDNLQILCRKHNIAKSNSLDFVIQNP
jgi:hypothetical protein